MEGTTRRRRYSYLTNEDRKILEALEPEAAQEFEALLQKQARNERAELEHGRYDDVGAQHSARIANFTHGAGGGHKRPAVAGHD